MKLHPFSFETPEVEIASQYNITTQHNVNPVVPIPIPIGAIDEILNSSGVIDNSQASEDDPNSALRKHFNSKGGTLEDVAQQVVNIMCRGETEASRLRAAEFISKIQGIQVEVDEKPQVKDVTINIFGSESKNLIQFVMPRS